MLDGVNSLTIYGWTVNRLGRQWFMNIELKEVHATF